ncbi:MAG: kinase [Eubacteriales bacterium]|nr:kinase [Eubacteriales bacterium]
MRLQSVQDLLKEKNIAFTYTEEDGLGSLDFLYRGVPYHIWEFADEAEANGVETNIRNAGKDEEIEGNYEEALLQELKNWP